MADDLRNASGSDSRDGSNGGEAVVTVPASENNALGPIPIAAINPLDPFTSRATVLTSNALTLMAYSLNWYAHAHGQPEYLPDWVLGFIWAPWGMNAWTWIKGRISKK
jgi:hypothetical protein